jgi:hypothetical protein
VSGKSGQFGVFGNSRHGKHGSHVENGAPGFRTVQKTDIVPVNPASSGEYRANFLFDVARHFLRGCLQ